MHTELQFQLEIVAKKYSTTNKYGTPKGSKQGTSKPNFQSTEKLTCSRCGKPGHKGSECIVSKGQTCNKCGGKNHFARMCKTKMMTSGNRDVKNQPRKAQGANLVALPDENDSSDACRT